MSDSVIIADSVSKRYAIGGNRARYKSLRDSLVGTVKGMLPSGRRQRAATNHIWALNGVSFEVKRGEVVGIIGRNGAGKSTLLKVLSRITTPTAGHIDIEGRIGSLLEVGTGFHPELSGRENIFLNGAILGMHRSEITRQFDAIVAFSEIERFLDTPVKHYSSGMYMRLAFGVAAHLEPEILMVDEVLAVGDAAFQEKCLGKMKDTANSGRTVLLVSHNMAAITQLCKNAILLDKGKVEAVGEAKAIVDRYWGGGGAGPAISTVDPSQHQFGSHRIQLEHVRLVNANAGSFTVHWREPLELEFQIRVKQAISNVNFGAAIFNRQGFLLCDTHSMAATNTFSFEPGVYHLRLTVANPLRAGSYILSLGAETSLKSETIFQVGDAAKLTVLDVAPDNVPYPHYLGGAVNADAEWATPQRLPEKQ